MNLVLIVCDTFRQDHLGCYGNSWIQTPNLDRLGADGVVFENAYACSYPTLPCRAEILTGKFVFPYLPWGPLPSSEVLISEVLAEHWYTSALVTDNIQLCRPNYGYDRGFHTRIRVRGQTYDPLEPPTSPARWPCAPELLRGIPSGRMEQYLRNTAHWTREEDHFSPRVAAAAVQWLEENHQRGPFFLCVDIFDPHEPWDPPVEEVERYDPGGTGANVINPQYGPAKRYDEATLRRIRALYAGEVTMTDRAIGRILDRLDALGRRDDTVVVFLSDHGIYLGDRGIMGKMGDATNDGGSWPPYCELSRIPYLIRAPGITPRRTAALVHPGDVMPTLLEFAKVPRPPGVGARSLGPLLRGEMDEAHPLAVSSWSLRGWSKNRPSVIRTREWALVFRRVGIPPELYHLPTDPLEQQNIYPQHRAEAKGLHRAYVEFLRRHGATPANLIPRLWMTG